MEETNITNNTSSKKSKKPNTKPVPAIITLGAAFVSCIISIFDNVGLGVFVERLLIVVVIFLIMGSIIKMFLDYSFKSMDEPTLIEQLENQELKEEESESEDSKNDSE